MIEINETDVGLFHVEDRADAFEFAVFVELWDREDWIDPGCGSVFARVGPTVSNPFLDVFG